MFFIPGSPSRANNQLLELNRVGRGHEANSNRFCNGVHKNKQTNINFASKILKIKSSENLGESYYEFKSILNPLCSSGQLSDFFFSLYGEWNRICIQEIWEHYFANETTMPLQDMYGALSATRQTCLLPILRTHPSMPHGRSNM